MMRLLIIFVLFLRLLPSWAEEPNTEPVVPAVRETKLKVGEKLWIRFSGIPIEDMIFFTSPFTVDESGSFKLPYLREAIVVTDCTPRQLAKRIAKAYRDGEVFPDLSVSVIRPDDPIPATESITVGGEVENGGDVSYHLGLTLSEAIKDRGGPTEFSDLSKVKLMRDDVVTKYDLSGDNLKNDPLLKRGDHILVQASRPVSRVKVSGQVKQPGNLSLKPKLTLEAAIAQCGGVEERGDLSKVKLMRNEKETTYNLEKSPKSSHLLLKSGDEIIVPKRPLPIPDASERRVKVGENIIVRFDGKSKSTQTAVATKRTTYKVSAEGTIGLGSLSDPIEAANSTAKQLADRIENAYWDRRIYRDLVVSVHFEDEMPPFNVGGAVRQPGKVAFRAEMTLHEIIALCGGPTGKCRHVKLIRNKVEQMIDLEEEPKDIQEWEPADEIVVLD